MRYKQHYLVRVRSQRLSPDGRLKSVRSQQRVHLRLDCYIMITYLVLIYHKGQVNRNGQH